MKFTSTTALFNAEHSGTLRFVHHALNKMVFKIDQAEEEPEGAFGYMERARGYASALQEQSHGVWACQGPSAALSMVSGLLSRTDTRAAAGCAEDFAELCWRAHGINAALSPYADDIGCQEFVGAFQALSVKLDEIHGR